MKLISKYVKYFNYALSSCYCIVSCTLYSLHATTYQVINENYLLNDCNFHMASIAEVKLVKKIN